jgi:hypothetical protein
LRYWGRNDPDAVFALLFLQPKYIVMSGHTLYPVDFLGRECLNMSAENVKPLSEAISSPILKAYKAGGYGLVFVFIGTLFVERGIFSYLIAHWARS